MPNVGSGDLKHMVAKHAETFTSIREDILGIRIQISDSEEALHELENVAPDDAELKRRAREIVGILAAQAHEGFVHHSALQGFSSWDAEEATAQLARIGTIETQTDALGFMRTNITHRAPTSAAHLAALFWPDQLCTYLFDAMKKGLSSSEMKQMSSKDLSVERERLEAEIDIFNALEEHLIRQAARLDISIPRRADALPQWLLTPDDVLEKVVSERVLHV